MHNHPYQIFSFKSLSSTMDKAKELYHKDAPLPFVVQAENQTNGRGRGEKTWESYDGNLLFTLVHSVHDKHRFQISLVMGAILCKIFDQLVPGKVTLKWPNDVLINSKKVSGILIEIISSHQHMLDVLIGVGVNCNDAPSLADYPTTALNRHVFPPLLKNELLSLILSECKKNFLLLENQGFEPFQEIWQKFHHQKHITISQKNHTITGNFKNITPMGLLVVEDDMGKLHTIQTGDLSV